MNAPSEKLTWTAERLVLLLVITLIGGAGCASGPYVKKFPPPPSEEVRAHLGTIGLVMPDHLTNSRLQSPLSPGAAVALGAGQGALAGFEIGAKAGSGGRELGGVLMIVIWSVAVPVGTIVGAATGHAEGMPVKERLKSEQQLHRAVLEADLPRRLQDEVLRLLCEKTSVSFVGPHQTTDATTNGAVDTILEVNVLNAGLCGGPERTAPLAVFLEVRVRLVRTCDGVELYAHTWAPRGDAATFEEWAANDAQGLRLVLPRMVPPLAESVVEELFLRHDPKQSSRSRR